MKRIEEVLKTKEATIVRREIKQRIAAPAHFPIYVRLHSTRPPHIVNEDQPHGWYTYGGDPVTHPAAYARKGFSYLTYIPDPRKIVVGENWLRRFAGGKSFREVQK